MKIVHVTYTAKADYTEQNQQNIRQVMSDLQKLPASGLLYHVCLSPDGKTFTHTAFFKSADEEQQLLTLPSFKYFQEQLKAKGIEVPPKQELLSLIGASAALFG